MCHVLILIFGILEYIYLIVTKPCMLLQKPQNLVLDSFLSSDSKSRPGGTSLIVDFYSLIEPSNGFVTSGYYQCKIDSFSNFPPCSQGIFSFFCVSDITNYRLYYNYTHTQCAQSRLCSQFIEKNECTMLKINSERIKEAEKNLIFLSFLAGC